MNRKRCFHTIIQVTLTLLVIGSFFGYYKDHQSRVQEAKMFREATKYASTGRWYWDVTNDKLEWDATMFQIFGKDKATWTPDYAGFEACLHPDDKARIKARVEQALANRDGYTGLFRVIREDGKGTFNLISGATASRDGSYMTGIVMPLTQHMLEDFVAINQPPTTDP